MTALGPDAGARCVSEEQSMVNRHDRSKTGRASRLSCVPTLPHGEGPIGADNRTDGIWWTESPRFPIMALDPAKIGLSSQDDSSPDARSPSQPMTRPQHGMLAIIPPAQTMPARSQRDSAWHRTTSPGS